MKLSRYVLDEHGEPRAEPDLTTWTEWMDRNQVARLVADNTFENLGIHGVRVSTIFLGRDHAEEGPPEVWETIVAWTAGDRREYMRCPGNREQAEAMHLEAMNRVLGSFGMELRSGVE